MRTEPGKLRMRIATRAAALLLAWAATATASAQDGSAVAAESLVILGKEVRIAMPRYAVLGLFDSAQLECVDGQTRLEQCDTINVNSEGLRHGSLHFELSRLKVAFRHWYHATGEQAAAAGLFGALFQALSGYAADGTLAPAAVTTFEQRREADRQVRNIYFARGRKEIRVTLLEDPADPSTGPVMTITEILR